MNNKSPSTRQQFPWRAAVDRLHLALEVTWSNYKEMQSRLKFLKESAGYKGELRHKGVDQIQYGPWLVRVSPTGWRRGSRGPYFSFVLEYEGVLFLIQDRPTSREDCPNVLVEIGGMACLERGDQGSLELVHGLFQQMGGRVDRLVLSRVDVCLDMPGVGMDEFAEAAADRRYVSKLKCHRGWDSNGTTVLFGKAPLQLEVYDKLAEVLSKQHPLRSSLMQARCWNGIMPTQAVRVEFRIWRAKLREFGIDTLAGFYCKRRVMVDYLCLDWFRFTNGPVDRRNTTRALTLPLWETVHAAFADWAGEANGEVLEPLPRGSVDVTRLLRTGYGILRAIGRAQGRDAVDYVDYCSWVTEKGLT